MLDAGIHFGHRTSRWNPKMQPYIFGKRNLIHIIDIRETVKGILRAKRFITNVVGRGQDVLFVGTKRQARASVEMAAKRVGMPYVIERWLGGTLTNFRTIRSRLSRLEELEAIEAEGMAGKFSKKMIATLTREQRKIRRNLEGIRTMHRLPGALVIIDIKREHIASREARKLGIPVVALIDTDSDPDFVDVPIPGNDDAMRAIDLILNTLADAVEEGKRGRPESEGREEGAPVAGQAPRRSSRVVARADEDQKTSPEGAGEAGEGDSGQAPSAENQSADSAVAST
jgi:small subunit ribosomal protein S2